MSRSGSARIEEKEALEIHAFALKVPLNRYRSVGWIVERTAGVGGMERCFRVSREDKPKHIGDGRVVIGKFTPGLEIRRWY